MGTSHFMGVGAWLESNTTIGDLVGGLDTVGRSPTASHGCIKWKTCVGLYQKGLDTPSSERPRLVYYTPTVKVQKKCRRYAELAVRLQKSATHKRYNDFINEMII